MKRTLPMLVFALALVTPATAQQTLRLPAQSGAVGTDLAIPVRVDPADGVSALELSVAYDPLVVVPSGVYRTATTQEFVLSAAIDVPGRVDLSLGGGPLGASADPDGQKIAWIVFEVVGAAGSTSALDWIGASVNGAPATTVAGSIEVIEADATVWMPDDVVVPSGQTLVIPVVASDATGALGIDLTVGYSGAVVQPLSVAKTPLTQSMTLTTNLTTPGQIRVSLFTTTPISGSGALVDVTFEATGADGTASVLDVTKARINEGLITTALDDGLVRICTQADGDGDTFSSCAGDCDDDDASVFPGATEQCDTRDNDCNGAVDDLPAPTGTAEITLLRLSTNSVQIDWTPVGGADAYDVVSGDLETLRIVESVGPAALDCAADDVDQPSITVDTALGPGEAVWYLQRAVNCGVPGSYDAPGPSQVADRDASLEGSSAACP